MMQLLEAIPKDWDLDPQIVLETSGYVPATRGFQSTFGSPLRVMVPGLYGIPWHLHFPTLEPTSTRFVGAAEQEGPARYAEEYDQTVRRWERWAAERLAEQWEAANAHRSSVRLALRDPAYKELRQLGDVALFVALQRLAAGSRQLWLAFLQSLTEERPAAGCPTVADAARAWILWGRRRGLVP